MACYNTQPEAYLSSSSGLLFEGNFNATHPQWRHHFEANCYHSTALDLTTARVFGGCTKRSCPTRPFQLNWTEWQSSGQDALGIVGEDPGFADPNWRESLNVTLQPGAPALRAGFRQIDTSTAGLLPPPPDVIAYA